MGPGPTFLMAASQCDVAAPQCDITPCRGKRRPATRRVLHDARSASPKGSVAGGVGLAHAEGDGHESGSGAERSFASGFDSPEPTRGRIHPNNAALHVTLQHPPPPPKRRTGDAFSAPAQAMMGAVPAMAAPTAAAPSIAVAR